MKLLMLLLCLSASAETVNEIETLRLDSRLVHTVYCHERNSGVTTVVFPAEISGIYAAGVDVKFNEKKPNPFLLSFTPGSAYFTVKSLSSNEAAGAVNVVFEKQVYVIHLKSVKRGHSSVTFIRAEKPQLDTGSPLRNKSRQSAAYLISQLDKAKAYHLIKKHYPAQAEAMDYFPADTLMEYSNHQILLKEVIRFKESDALYFHVQIKNKRMQELRYNPKDFAVNISDRIYYSALVDASGKVPGQGTATAWFCIQGTKDGRLNKLDVKNDWKVLLNVSQMPEPLKKESPVKPDTKKEAGKVIKTVRDIEVQEARP